jgi:phosphatidylserine decarboxylase
LFIKIFNIDLEETDINVNKCKNVQEVFVRKLKPGIRTIGEGIISPVDGTVMETGKIIENKLIQSKGINYKLNDLIPENKVQNYVNGWYITIYLSPHDYHRIHCIYDGIIKKFYYQPGDLWPVNNITVPNLKGLFTLNERVTTFLETDLAELAIVKVGAMCVGNITLKYFNNNQSIHNNYKPGYNFLKNEYKIKKGDELGMFTFGSTVILLFPENIKQPDFDKFKNKKIKLGKTICLT